MLLLWQELYFEYCFLSWFCSLFCFSRCSKHCFDWSFSRWVRARCNLLKKDTIKKKMPPNLRRLIFYFLQTYDKICMKKSRCSNKNFAHQTFFLSSEYVKVMKLCVWKWTFLWIITKICFNKNENIQTIYVDNIHFAIWVNTKESTLSINISQLELSKIFNIIFSCKIILNWRLRKFGKSPQEREEKRWS